MMFRLNVLAWFNQYRNKSIASLSILLFATATPVFGIQFEEVTDLAGISYQGSSFGASWGDVNGDGQPDVWTGNHGRWSAGPTLYLNGGDGTFSDAAHLIDYTLDDFHGASWADLDNDGDQDLLMLVGAGSGVGSGLNQLFVNSGGLLQEKAQEFGLDYPLGRGRTPLWFDWNSDGLLDAFLANWARPDGQAPSSLFSQSETGFADSFNLTGLATFTNNSYAQLTGLGSNRTSVLMIRGNPFPDAVYDYGVTPFVNLDASSSLFPSTLWSVRDTAVADLNGDLLPDVFMARVNNESEVIQRDSNTIAAHIEFISGGKGFSFDGGTTLEITIDPRWLISPANIYIGSQGVHPSNQAFTLSAADPSVIGMPVYTPGIDFGVFIGYDPASDQWQFFASKSSWLGLNFVVSAAEQVTDPEAIGFVNSDGALADRLFVQNQTGFEDFSQAAGLANPSPCEGVTAADFDNDMDVDLYLVCRGSVGNRPNMLYENLGDGTFQEVANAAGARASTEGRGDTATSADYDGDGFVDLFVTNGDGGLPFNDGPSQLFRNMGNGNRWIEVDLEGVVSNRDGIGAQLLVTAGGITQYREQSGGMHRFSQDHKRIHLGLADNETVDSIAVSWPSGIVQDIPNLPANEIVHILEPSFPSSMGIPSYQPGQDAGVYLWKDTFDGPYHLRVGGDGPISVFSVELVTDKPIDSVTPSLLEANDVLAWGGNHMVFASEVTTWDDRLDFRLSPGSNAMIAVKKDAKPNPRQLHVGATGQPITPSGWLLDIDQLSEMPEFQAGQDLGLFVGRDLASGEVRARWNGDGRSHRTAVSMLFSEAPNTIQAVSLELHDSLIESDNSVTIDGYVSTYWDGLNISAPSGTVMGLAYTQDGLFQADRVNPFTREIGAPDAYWLPKAEPYGLPSYDMSSEAGLFLWKDKLTGVWHVRCTAGNTHARYTGEIVSDQPFNSVVPVELEGNDELNTTTTGRIAFDLKMWSPWQDGFDFTVPTGATVSLALQPQPGENPADAILVGAERWPVERVPLDLSGW